MTNSRTSLPDLLAGMGTFGDEMRVRIPDDWLQGRAIYGGLSTALCLQAVLRQTPDLPPLRSALVSFIGPAGGEVAINSQVARRGKSTAFVNANLSADGAPGVQTSFCFGAARQSQFNSIDLPAPEVGGPDAGEPFFAGPDGKFAGPDFARNFEGQRVGGAHPMSGADDPDFQVWMRLHDGVVDPAIIGLVALADALPPAAMACFTQPAPISSMTWMFDLLTPEPSTEDGWWLCRSTAQTLGEGYSSQAMTVWNSRREPVLVGRQNVAIFA